MTHTRSGIPHPGDVGISIAVSAKNGGHDVLWAPGGRSTVSVSPPHAAEVLTRCHSTRTLSFLAYAVIPSGARNLPECGDAKLRTTLRKPPEACRLRIPADSSLRSE